MTFLEMDAAKRILESVRINFHEALVSSVVDGKLFNSFMKKLEFFYIYLNAVPARRHTKYKKLSVKSSVYCLLTKYIIQD